MQKLHPQINLMKNMSLLLLQDSIDLYWNLFHASKRLDIHQVYAGSLRS